MDKRQEALLKRFEYRDGVLYRKYNRGPQPCLARHSLGYIQVRFGGKVMKAHRIIWEMHHGDVPPGLEIDHINGVRDDNRIENLRLLTHQQNCANRRRKPETLPGARFVRATLRKPWQAMITVRGVHRSLGYYATREEASAAYQAALHASQAELPGYSAPLQ